MALDVHFLLGDGFHHVIRCFVDWTLNRHFGSGRGPYTRPPLACDRAHHANKQAFRVCCEAATSLGPVFFVVVLLGGGQRTHTGPASYLPGPSFLAMTGLLGEHLACSVCNGSCKLHVQHPFL